MAHAREPARPLRARGHGGGRHLLACELVGGRVHDGTAAVGGGVVLGPGVEDRAVDLLQVHGLLAEFVVGARRSEHPRRGRRAQHIRLVHARVVVVLSHVLSDRNSLDGAVVAKRLFMGGLCAVDAHVGHQR